MTRAAVVALLLLAQPAIAFAPARGARRCPRAAALRERAVGSQDALAVPLGAAALFGVIVNRLLFAGELPPGTQSRADLIAVAAAGGLVLNGLSLKEIDTKVADSVRLEGVRGKGVNRRLLQASERAPRLASPTAAEHRRPTGPSARDGRVGGRLHPRGDAGRKRVPVASERDDPEARRARREPRGHARTDRGSGAAISGQGDVLAGFAGPAWARRVWLPSAQHPGRFIAASVRGREHARARHGPKTRVLSA